MELNLFNAFLILMCVYALSRIVGYMAESNEEDIKRREEQARLDTLAKLYGRDRRED